MNTTKHLFKLVDDVYICPIYIFCHIMPKSLMPFCQGAVVIFHAKVFITPHSLILIIHSINITSSFLYKISIKYKFLCIKKYQLKIAKSAKKQELFVFNMHVDTLFKSPFRYIVAPFKFLLILQQLCCCINNNSISKVIKLLENMIYVNI